MDKCSKAKTLDHSVCADDCNAFQRLPLQAKEESASMHWLSNWRSCASSRRDFGNAPISSACATCVAFQADPALFQEAAREHELWAQADAQNANLYARPMRSGPNIRSVTRVIIDYLPVHV